MPELYDCTGLWTTGTEEPHTKESALLPCWHLPAPVALWEQQKEERQGDKEKTVRKTPGPAVSTANRQGQLSQEGDKQPKKSPSRRSEHIAVFVLLQSPTRGTLNCLVHLHTGSWRFPTWYSRMSSSWASTSWGSTWGFCLVCLLSLGKAERFVTDKT